MAGKLERVVPVAIEHFDRAAWLFPQKMTFRALPAISRVYFFTVGFAEYRADAIREVEQALLTIPNSKYLRDHLAELRR